MLNFSKKRIHEKVAVFNFYTFDNFDFTRKIAENILGEKLVKMLGFSTLKAVDNFDFTRKFVGNFSMKNS